MSVANRRGSTRLSRAGVARLSLRASAAPKSFPGEAEGTFIFSSAPGNGWETAKLAISHSTPHTFLALKLPPCASAPASLPSPGRILHLFVLHLGGACLRSPQNPHTTRVRFQHECTSLDTNSRITLPAFLFQLHTPTTHLLTVAMEQQYGNGGYNQIGYGANPYDQREEGPAGGRYNNFAQGRYDDRTSSPTFGA